jgi:hypothetical protein
MFKSTVGIAVLGLTIGAGGCNSPAQETRDDAKETSSDLAEASADAQRQREADVSRLNERIAQIERDYAAKGEQLAAGKKAAASGLREEVHEDVTNVKQAVANLATTTEDNWWQREEEAIRRSVDDVGSDVKRLAGRVDEPNPVATDTSATAPFTSRRDAFVTAMKGRLNTFQRALDDVKADGPREAELSDTKARVEKMAEDLDNLANASADDWWDVTKDRVEAYLDRVEDSVRRLDDHQAQTN